MAHQRRAGSELLATGNTSDVWLASPTTVLKLLRPGVPAHWARIEADITDALHAAGLPVPAVEETLLVRGRPGIVFERIDGVSLWDRMQGPTSDLRQLVAAFVGLQAELHATGPIPGIPDLVARTAGKIGQVVEIPDDERATALRLLAGLPTGTALCHGDMHPRNVLVSDRGMVIVDWFDAAIGHSAADFVRSSLLIRPPLSETDRPAHLTGATPSFLARLHREYQRRLSEGHHLVGANVDTWEGVLAVARMSEPVDTTDMLRIWRSHCSAPLGAEQPLG